MATWPPSDSTLAKLEYLRKLLSLGIDNPLTHAGSVGRLHAVLHEVTELAPTVEQVRLNPIEWLVKAIQWLADNVSCPECPECDVPGPLLADSYIADEHHADGELNYDLRQSYQGGNPDDPPTAAKVEVEIATTILGTPDIQWGVVGWSASWYLTIGAAQATHQNQINQGGDNLWQMRCRFVDASNAPLSAWAYSDQRYSETI